MIAVAVSLLFGLYVLGPDAISRFVLGFTIPRRSITLTRSEEITRALIWAILSFVLADLWLRTSRASAATWNPAAARTLFAGIYSEAFFAAHGDLWFAALHSVFWFNVALLWRLYTVVLLLSLALSATTHYYGLIRSRLPPWTWIRRAFAALVLPRVAQWHVLLSKLLLEDRSLAIQLDVLTKSDKLYQGELADKSLAADGSLVSVTLASPRRFDRARYLAARAQHAPLSPGSGSSSAVGAKPKSGPEPEADPHTESRANLPPDTNAVSPEGFWRIIPTNIFLIMASDINTMNLRYLPGNRRVRPLKPGSPEMIDLLQQIARDVQQIKEQDARDGVTSPEHDS